ncbi:Anti-Muellerian hormone type-2 receptor [Hibiscus syriacus]|uniref:Anti-Muellerian hormone type-2 receptor n=1 Tax=Hibiscus syriacus TaxID=106335 RepID=A0A6A2YFV6_HIBSY|nr:F-box protein At5g49610-like [Hibiscus syriacus]KAE8672634.1 Anti-Muellerian hormone type-2 receptor [Hibiscus syriacus]
MDRGKKLTNLYGNKNNNIYMDLKDIIRENALPYLPAKSLFRCSGVCRDWKLLISTPFFAHNQSNSFRSISGFFYQTQAGVPSFMSLDPMAYGVPDPSLEFLPEPVEIRCSSNGLLCCQGCTDYKAYYICNPVTKHWEKLPKPEADHGPDPAVVLAFEPSLLNFTADYKLICAFPSELDGFEFEIYSSGTRSWRISGEIYFSNRKLLPKSGIHVNGTAYWQTSLEIIAFDLSSERCQLLYKTVGSLGTKNGKLCMAHVHGRSQNLVVRMLSDVHSNTMQMHSAAELWKELPRIHLDVSPAAFSSSWYFYGHGGVEFIGGDVVLFRDGNMFYCYDMKKKASENLGQVDIDIKAGIVGYVNSLVDLQTVG